MDQKETATIVISIGVSVFLIGAVLLMDKALILSGDILIIVGVILLAKSRLFSLLHPDRVQGCVVFCIGILFLASKYFVFGLILHVSGIFMILRGYLPSLKGTLRDLLFGKFGKLFV